VFKNSTPGVSFLERSFGVISANFWDVAARVSYIGTWASLAPATIA
jgi:hypothetical protein